MSDTQTAGAQPEGQQPAATQSAAGQLKKTTTKPAKKPDRVAAGKDKTGSRRTEKSIS